MNRFKRMNHFFDYFYQNNLEPKKLHEWQRLFLFKKMYKDYDLKKYDIEPWQDDTKKYNRIKYVFKPHNTFGFIWCWLKSLFNHTDFFHKKGVHLIDGYMGSGKTLLMNKLIRDVDDSKYFWYSTKDEFYGDNIEPFPINVIFQNNEQVKSIPTVDKKGRHLYGLIMDEINLTYNRRMNRTKKYNETFIGLIEFIVSSRHQGIPRVYFIGQKKELQDTQLMSLVRYNHNCLFTRMRYNYQSYKEGTFTLKPKKIFVDNYEKKVNMETGLEEFMYINKAKVKINRFKWGTYNTHALAEDYLSLPSFKESDNKKGEQDGKR